MIIVSFQLAGFRQRSHQPFHPIVGVLQCLIGIVPTPQIESFHTLRFTARRFKERHRLVADIFFINIGGQWGQDHEVSGPRHWRTLPSTCRLRG